MLLLDGDGGRIAIYWGMYDYLNYSIGYTKTGQPGAIQDGRIQVQQN